MSNKQDVHDRGRIYSSGKRTRFSKQHHKGSQYKDPGIWETLCFQIDFNCANNRDIEYPRRTTTRRIDIQLDICKNMLFNQ